MDTVKEFTYLGDRVSAGSGCEAAVTAFVLGELSLWSAVSCCITGDLV